jgi:OmpA-OmpF porin, OOP family
MNPVTKILLGAVATTALAWFLHGPMKFGEKCAAASNAAVVAPTPAGPGMAATQEQVASCQTKVNETIAGKTINFTSGGATIAPDSQVLLDAIAASAKDCAGTQIEVQGHTDASGGTAANLRLSEARANAVVQALVSKGVPTERLLPKGYGETVPVDPAGTSAAYAKNRRIDFKVASSAAAPAVGQ